MNANTEQGDGAQQAPVARQVEPQPLILVIMSVDQPGIFAYRHEQRLNGFLRLVVLREHFAEIIIEGFIIGLQFYGVSIVGLSLLRIIKLLIGFSKINPGIGMVRFKFRDTLIVA